MTAKKKKSAQTYNTEDSPVVTHLSTSSALTGLTRGERTGSRIFQWPATTPQITCKTRSGPLEDFYQTTGAARRPHTVIEYINSSDERQNAATAWHMARQER
ncbi:hypothetical protein ACKVWM_003662 [Pyricularia oryzae]